VCDLETLWMRRHWPTGGCRARILITAACTHQTVWRAWIKRITDSLIITLAAL